MNTVLHYRQSLLRQTQSSKVALILIVYLLARLGQTFLPLIETNTLANTRYPNTNLVAVIVDQELYKTSAQSSIERYAQRYIQSRLSDTKAIIFPVDTNTITSADIVKLLENLYYHGEDEQASTLQGVVLIGNIPLPKVCPVEEESRCFPSLFPYTDFDEAKYYRNPDKNHFSSNNKPNAKAELRHGVINIGSSASDYINYFLKLKSYATNPQQYIGTGIWYDDLIDQKQSFNTTAFPYYLNNFLFAEDIAYHRYNPLLVDIYNGLHNNNITSIVNKVSSLTGESGSYGAQVGSAFSELSASFAASDKNSASQTPTVFVDDALGGFMKGYGDLYGATSRLRARDNVLAAGRRNTNDIDSHDNKISRYDSLYTKTLGTDKVPLLVEVNKVLESKLIQEVNDKKYALRLAIPVSGKIQRNNLYRAWAGNNPTFFNHLNDIFGNSQYYDDGIYEAFYYGRNAADITGLDQTSIFLGTPNPLYNNITNINSISGASSTTSIGASHGILSQFVEANRAYNTNNSTPDKTLREQGNNTNICGDNNMEGYIREYRGGNTPLNMSGYQTPDGQAYLDLKYKNYDRAGVSKRIGQNMSLFQPSPLPDSSPSLYDIGGSKEITNPQPWMFAELLQGGYLQRVAYEDINIISIINSIITNPIGWLVGFNIGNFKQRKKVDICDSATRNSEPLTNYDIMNISGATSTGYYKTITISTPSGVQTLQNGGIACPSNPSTGSACFPYSDKPAIPAGQFVQKQELSYKTIDSVIVHNSPNPEQISGLTMTTLSRPIDSVRYITFRGIGGSQVKLPFPNLYAINVYTTGSSSGELVLKSVPEIKQSILQYLQGIVDEYNTNLTQQLNNRTNYFNTNPSMFATLGQADPLATPARSYPLLDRNIFVNQVGDDYIDAIAQILYTTNSIVPRKGISATISQEIEQVQSLSSITPKKKTILADYLSKKTNPNLLAFPGYQASGYELIALVSDGKDEITSTNIPNSVKQAQARRTQFQDNLDITNRTADAAQEEGNKKNVCAGPYGEPVPLFDISDLSNVSFPWFDALGCWLEHVKVPQLTIDFRNNQGNLRTKQDGKVVLVPDFLQAVRDPFDNTPNYQVPTELTANTDTTNTTQQTIINNFSASLSSQAYLLDTTTPADLQPQLILDYHGDSKVANTALAPLRITITSTGSDCLLIDGTNTCNNAKTLTLVGYDKKILILTPSQKKTGNVSVSLRICNLSSAACVNKTLGVSIAAGPIKTLSRQAPSTTMLIGTTVPVQISAKDEYGNSVSRSLSPYFVVTSGGTVNNSQKIQINDFRTSLFVQSDNSSGANTVLLSLQTRSGTVLSSQSLGFVAGSLSLQSVNGATGTRNTNDNTLTYTLPHDKSARYTRQSGRSVLLPDNLPRIQLSLRDSNNRPLAGSVSITVEKGLVRPGIIRRDIDTMISGADIKSIITPYFDQSNTIVIDQNGSSSLYFMPIGQAGSDRITLTLPDGTTNSFTVTIKASTPAQVVLTQSGSSLLGSTEPGSLQQFRVSVLDTRGNTISSPGIIKLSALGSLRFLGSSAHQQTLVINSGSESLSVQADSIGGPGYLLASMIDETIVPDTRVTSVQQSIIPQTGLNGMYLSLLGSDRGKLQSGSYQSSLSSLLVNSPKLLAITTALSTQEGTALGSSSSPDKQVGWRNDQHHLTEFGQGKSVGEATATNADESLINLGDPLITRISNNPQLTGVEFDDGPGQLILSTSDKSIVKSFSADINGDKLKDIVTVFADGSVTRQKNYGGDQSFVNMGPLLQIFDNISDVYRSDTAGDGFDDIIVQLSDGSLRVYPNSNSIFDVDGYPLCLTGTKDQLNPSNIRGFDQWFIQDMDKDGKDDIITNNEGMITIIYGKNNSQGHSYISNNHQSCDTNRQTRQQSQTKTLTTFATQIAGGMQIVDDSLIRRKGLSQTSQGVSSSTEDDTPVYEENPTVISDSEADQEPGLFGGVGDILAMIKSLFSSPSAGSNIPNIGSFPINNIIDNATDNLLRWSSSPTEYTPIYEQSLSGADLRYITIPQVSTTDQIKVYKTFEDLNGATLRPDDIVEVTVHIQGVRNDPLTYIDHINGPRKVAFENNQIQDWNPKTLNSDHQYVAIEPQDGYMFVVDNIRLGAANDVSFSYRISYQGGSASKIKISDRNNDQYPDISVYPLDGCSKFFWIYENTRSLLQSYRDYSRRFVDLGAKVNEYSTTLSNNTQNYISSLTNSIQSLSSSSQTGQAQEILNGLGGEHMSFGQFFSNVFAQGGTSANINMNLLGDWDAKMQTKVKDAMESICGGNLFGKQENSCKKGLPVPFNMAFLAPGDFNIFGCRIPKKGQLVPGIYPTDNGFPAFWFPGTLQSPVGPIPVPRGPQKMSGVDKFGYFGFPAAGGVYPSQIRIYLAPTLTMELGAAVCFGPQVGGMKIPAPFNHIAGNCIVTKIPLPSDSCDSDTTEGEDGLSDEDLADLAEFGQCATPPIRPTDPSNPVQTSDSPFQLVNIQNGVISNPFPSGTYFGIVNIERTVLIKEDQPTNDDGDYLQGGKEVRPQLQGGLPGAKGLVQCVVNDWMDRQVNYMINNLTNMQIGVYLPDVSQLGQGFENIGEQTVDFNTDGFQQFGQSFGQSGNINNQDDTFSGNIAYKIRNATLNQSALNHLSDGVNNPFDQISKLFEQTPLIRISTTDVQVKVPFLYAEDIARYESYLKTRAERNKKTTSDREGLLQGALGLCGKQYRVSINTGGQISGLNFNPNQVLDSQYFSSLYNKLSSEQTAVKKHLQDLQACQAAQGDITNAACKQIAKDFQSSPKELAKVEQFLESQLNRSNACFSFFFKGKSGQGQFELNTSIKGLVSLSTQGEKLQTSIRANIKVLDQYKRFPLQLYQRTHVVDRYLSETVTTVDNFLGSINLWLRTNASRFEQYVDAIIMMKTAIQSWQAIIDLSTNRQKKCSTCTVDNYDAYACQLGFLCKAMKPPLLRLPPFKIPNITLDLSHMDLGMQILLPRFQFVPTSVPLPQIPDLPQTPNLILPSTNDGLVNFSQPLVNAGVERTINETKINKTVEELINKLSQGTEVNIPDRLPELPIIPQPPTLPELPSFIPNIKLQLPDLPPAPRIPNLSPQFETILNVASFVSDLYCIVKSGIGLVGESGVKTRVEQLTQRTQEIPFFDNINLSRDMSYQQDKLFGFDYKIDAFTSFNYNFSYVYDLIAGLAKGVNAQTDKLLNRSEKSTQIGNIPIQVGGFSGTINDGVNEINNTTQQNIDLSNPLGFVSPESDTIPAQRENLNKVISFLAHHETTPQDKKEELLGLQSRLNQTNAIIPNTERLTELQKEQNNTITKERQTLSQLSENFSSYKKYEAFLDQISTTSGSTSDGSEKDISLSLLSGDSKILSSYTDLHSDYLQVQQNLLTNYRKGLEGVTDSEERPYAQEILHEIAYLQSGINIVLKDEKKNKNTATGAPRELASLYRTHTAYQTLKYRTQASACAIEDQGISSPLLADSTSSDTLPSNNFYPYAQATAQLGNPSQPSAGVTDMTQLLDFSQDKQGVSFEVSTSSGSRYKTIVSSEYFANSNQGTEQIDINNDNHNDVLLRTTNSVWIKYAKQIDATTISTTTNYTKLYVAPVRTDADQRSKEADDNGLLEINDTILKVSSKDFSVKNLSVDAQDYDSFTVSWTNSLRQQDTINGYLIEISTLPDLYHLKAYDDIPDSLSSRYVLMLPEGTDTNGRIGINHQLTVKQIQDYLTGTIIDVKTYSPTNQTLRYAFSEIPRAWYYTRIVSLYNNGSPDKPIYMPSAAWSHPIVAGQQIIADTNGPEADVALWRKSTNKVVDTGLAPQGLVNTNYDLIVSWTDPNGVRDNWIETLSGQIIAISSGASNKIPNIYLTQSKTQQYRIIARDWKDNTTRETVALTINTPRIAIDSIENTSGNNKIVRSSLEDGMDEGIIKYEKKRNGTWSLLPVTMPGIFNYNLGLDQTVISGGVYNQSELINFYLPNPNGTGGDILMATVNKSNGQIRIEPQFSNRIVVRVDLTSNRPVFTLSDKVTGSRLFTLSLKANNTSLTALGGASQVVALTGNAYGSFAGGSCLKGSDDNCIVTVTPDKQVVIQAPYHLTLQGIYNYNENTKETSITFSQDNLGTLGSVQFVGTIE